MKNKKTLVGILAAAIGLNTGCVGFRVENTLSGLLSIGQSPEKGRQLEVGGEEAISMGGIHSLRVGFLYNSLPAKEAETSKLKIGSLVDEDVKTVHGDRDVVKISLEYDHKVWKLKPANWYSQAVLLGGGVEIVSIYSTDLVQIGDSDSIEVPNPSPIDQVRLFLDPSFEVELGKKPYTVFPVRLGTWIYFNGCDGAGCFKEIASLGYTLNWSEINSDKDSKDNHVCDYLPDRKDMPLEFLFEGKEERSDRCIADYHQADGGRHINLTVYPCKPEECNVRYNRMVGEHKNDKWGKEIPATDECHGEERFGSSGIETYLTCNLYNIVFEGVVSSSKEFDCKDNQKILDNLVNDVKYKVGKKK